jgi:hypothetical protein
MTGHGTPERTAMHRISALLAALAIMLCLLTPRDTTRPPAGAAPFRHYLGGWTRTTQYIDCCITASGRTVFYGELAAPPAIPFGSRVTIPGLGRFVVADRGGAVWGNHLDLWVPYVGYHDIKDWYRGVYWTA